MGMSQHLDRAEISRAEIDALAGAVVLEFGATWCPICIAAQPLIKTAVQGRPDVQHLKIEDGQRRPLGRSFRVKLWPTLVFLRDGKEIARVVRPDDAGRIDEAIALIDT